METMGQTERDHASFEPRCIKLSRRRVLTVRAVVIADLEPLVVLYQGLSLDDAYHRFFSGYHPPREVIRHWCEVESRGGYGLVAVLDDPEESTNLIVAHAGYEQLSEHEGEFAITVAHEWRGWLGPYLFDALIDIARARGIANLRSDVLLDNAPMLAIVRRRGYATIEHPDWSTVRVLVSTEGTTPSWPHDASGPRVLVEVPGGRWAAEQQAREAGFEVIACPGPTHKPDGHCPVLEGHRCPLVEGADAVVLAMPGGDPMTDRLLIAHHQQHPEVPLVVHRRGRVRHRELVEEPPGEPAPFEGLISEIGLQASPADAVKVLRRVIDGDDALEGPVTP